MPPQVDHLYFMTGDKGEDRAQCRIEKESNSGRAYPAKNTVQSPPNKSWLESWRHFIYGLSAQHLPDPCSGIIFKYSNCISNVDNISECSIMIEEYNKCLRKFKKDNLVSAAK